MPTAVTIVIAPAISATTQDAQSGALVPRQSVQLMEIGMRNTALIILGALLITGSTIQITMASEHHAHKVYRDNFRGAYDQLNVSPEAERNIENFGFSGRDPSRVGGFDPNLNPPS